MLNKKEFYNHLQEDLIPFWNNLYDAEHGGFYGSVDSDNIADKTSPKSGVLQTRLLWFYSSCYRTLKDEKLLQFADRQFEFIAKYMTDSNDGGVYWSVEYNGKVKDSRKHPYVLAFALYANSAYYTASGNQAAHMAADKLFDLIEREYKDECGYVEPFSLDNFSRDSVRSMNTLLHIIEAYAEYHRSVNTDKSRAGLEYAVNLARNKAYNGEQSRFECYFDKRMNSVGNVLSYGHDIEASWLIYRACAILGNESISADFAPKLDKVAQNIIKKGLTDNGKNGIYYCRVDDTDNVSRSWWVMAEAVVALVHRYVLYGDAQSMTIAEHIWEYIKKYFISQYGEWHSGVDGNGSFIKSKGDLCGAWKCPYHNGRMCLELMEMLKTLE